MRVLLVEDDALLGDGIRAGLRHAGFEVDWVRNGAENGRYGFPTSDEYDYEGGKAQDFQGGKLTWAP